MTTHYKIEVLPTGTKIKIKFPGFNLFGRIITPMMNEYAKQPTNFYKVSIKSTDATERSNIVFSQLYPYMVFHRNDFEIDND